MSIRKRFSRGALLVAFAAATNPASAAPEIAAKASCATKNAEARQSTDYPVERPKIAEELRLAGRSLVQVELSERGMVRNVAVAKSSGSALLDAAAKDITLQQRYTPEVRNCANVAGSYLIEVNFTD